MNIIPLTTYGVSGNFGQGQDIQTDTKVSSGQPTFLDVFTRIFDSAVETNQIKAEDAVRIMLGEADDLEQIQLNIQKAELAVELLVNVRNTVLDSYNEIVRMQV